MIIIAWNLAFIGMVVSAVIGFGSAIVNLFNGKFVLDGWTIPGVAAAWALCALLWVLTLLLKKGEIDPMTDEVRPKVPNPRVNAARLGFRLLVAAANPFSGMSRDSAGRASWQPLDPYGWPRWWPLGAFRGRAVPADALQLMHRASLGARWHQADQTKSPERVE